MTSPHLDREKDVRVIEQQFRVFLAQAIEATKNQATRHYIDKVLNGDDCFVRVSEAVTAVTSLLAAAAPIPEEQRVERLEEMLRAFVGEEVVYLTGAEPDDDEQAIWVPASDIRAARALLAETADGGGK